MLLQLTIGYSDVSCFAVPLTCFPTFSNHFALSLYVTGWSHIPLQNLTLSWLPGLMSLLLFSFYSLSKKFTWFIWNIVFWTYCSVLTSYLLSLDDVATTLCFSSSITTFSPLLSTLYLFLSWSLVTSLWSSPLLYRSKQLRFFVNGFLLTFIFFSHFGSWGFDSFVLKPSFFATTQPAAVNSQFIGMMFSVTI